MKLSRRIAEFLLLGVIVIVNVYAWQHRHDIADWFRLRNYTPSSEVANLATESSMTDYGRRLFYVNHPLLEQREQFNTSCANHSEKTMVLGCYHGDRLGIFLYDVTDERLNGVQQVTAAHEMLHQAYDRLSRSEKKRIGDQLTAFYDTLTDEQLKQKIDSYKSQGADITNELHSIIATEIADVPVGLEQYYTRYFSNRKAVVGLFQKYHDEFTRRELLVKSYDDQLASKSESINRHRESLDTQAKVLNDMARELSGPDARRSAADYNAKVDQYNALVEKYNSELKLTRGLISEYNRIVDARNAIAFEERQLQEALDSRLDSSQAPAR